MTDVDLNSSRQQSQSVEADRIVGESAQLDLIRTIIDEKGMDPIWAHLIKQFGSLMYLKGLETSPPHERAALRKSA